MWLSSSFISFPLGHQTAAEPLSHVRRCSTVFCWVTAGCEAPDSRYLCCTLGWDWCQPAAQTHKENNDICRLFRCNTSRLLYLLLNSGFYHTFSQDTMWPFWCATPPSCPPTTRRAEWWWVTWQIRRTWRRPWRAKTPLSSFWAPGTTSVSLPVWTSSCWFHTWTAEGATSLKRRLGCGKQKPKVCLKSEKYLFLKKKKNNKFSST